MPPDDVCVRWKTPSLISASVRDAAAGIVDIRWTGYGGWSCSCRDECCAHISAVRQITEAGGDG
jgi:hypothetical protein